MSKFTTTIPINVEEVKSKLPAGAYIHGIKMGEDKTSLVMTWDSDLFRTKYECIEFPVEALHSGNLPKEVVLTKTVPVAETPKPEPEQSVVVGNKEVATPAVKRNKKAL